MGQKIHPIGFRVGVNREWSTRWYAGKKDFADLLVEDQMIREKIKKQFYQAGISRVDIERRSSSDVKLIVFTAKPGIIIGRGGQGIDQLKKDLETLLKKTVSLDIVEIKNIDSDAQLVAESVAAQIEKRASFRRAMKQAIGRVMKAGAKGVKIMVSGRLGGAEIARSERYREGSIPLQTLRAYIDYGFAEAHTISGRIGIKVWVYKGQVVGKKAPELAPRTHAPRRAEGGK